jgi:uncharacterized protein YecT (DUF1311 family)
MNITPEDHMKRLLPILLLFIASIGHAQSIEHPIDIRTIACLDLDSNQTTYGMIQCESIAREEWNTEMNKYYNLLVDTLSDESGVLLSESQKTWTEFNQNEQKFSSSLYYSEMQGTMWHVVNAGRRSEIVRQRALELKQYYETYMHSGM